MVRRLDRDFFGEQWRRPRGSRPLQQHEHGGQRGEEIGAREAAAKARQTRLAASTCRAAILMSLRQYGELGVCELARLVMTPAQGGILVEPEPRRRRAGDARGSVCQEPALWSEPRTRSSSARTRSLRTASAVS